MNEWSGVFLAVIAAATLVMALIQVGAIVAVLRIARQAQDTLTSVQREVKPLMAEVKPLLAKATDMADEASRTLTLAKAQAEKVDVLVTDLARRVDETSVLVQQAIVTPARQGLAIMAAVKAALGAFRGFHDFRGRMRRPSDEDDPLFIG